MKIHVASAKIAGRYIFAVLPNSWLCKNSISLKQLKLEFYRSGSFHSASLTLTDLTPAVQMLKWSLPSPQKKTNNGWGWILRSGRGQLRDTRSTSAALPTTRDQVMPATLLIPVGLFLFLWWRSFTVPDTKVAPFP